jgi:chromosome segregation protein
LDNVRNKENEKSLTAQKLQHIKERKQSLDEFLQKSSGQVKGLEESISFSGVR